jgi:hypothetical protein
LPKLSNQDLADWSAAIESSGCRQYVADVRRFLAQTCEPRLSSSDDLVKYVMSLPGVPSRSRAVSALGSFYAFLHDNGRVAANPARRLSRRLKHVAGANALRHALCLVCGEERARGLRWRDVAIVLIGAGTGPPCIAALAEADRALLLRRVQRRIAAASFDSVAIVCADSVFDGLASPDLGN